MTNPGPLGRDVRQEVVLARDQIDERGHLDLRIRQQLRALIESLLGPPGWSGLQRRVALHVLPIARDVPGADELRALLDDAAARPADRAIRHDLEARFGTAQTTIEGYGASVDDRAASAAWAALAAVSACLWGAPRMRADDDLELDPLEWEAAFYASAAVAGGAPWDDDTDNNSRRAFWGWYLDQVVALAEGASTA